MTETRHRAALRLSLFYIAIFSFIGIAMPFWPVWLEAKGLAAGAIGVLLALPMWVRVLATPLVAAFADRFGEVRRPLVLLSLGSLAAYALFLFADRFWSLFALTVVSAALLAPIMPLADALTVRLAAAGRLDYGRVRLWGSLSFIVAAIAGGRYLADRPADTILALMLAGLALTAFGAVALPDRRQASPARLGHGILRLIADRRVLLLLAAGGLIQSSHAALFGFGSLYWLAAGRAPDTVGWLWAIGVAAEIALFAVGGALLRRLGPARLLMLGGAAAVVRWLAIAASADLVLLVFAQALHAGSFAASHLAAMDFLARFAPAGSASSAQSLYAAVSWGAIFGLSMLLAGYLYQTIGAGAFLAMAGLALAGTLTAAMLERLAPQHGDRP